MSKKKEIISEKIDQKMAESPAHDRRVSHIFRRILHLLEMSIAALTIIVLVLALCVEVYNIFIVSGYPADFEEFLHSILTIVVGLEFVRMLIDMTPGNTIEVLIMATARQIIISHSNATLLIGVVCIAGLFATRRFLIRRSELEKELVEME
ncbi:MAG: hypothetical protein IJ375_03895 [Oscillospiraceae bacterium]|nr:hypothetical protein [Oscillospiraceae bacterium]